VLTRRTAHASAWSLWPRLMAGLPLLRVSARLRAIRRRLSWIGGLCGGDRLDGEPVGYLRGKD
jgi:hypothetical protein